jgi:uncharacterized protein
MLFKQIVNERYECASYGMVSRKLLNGLASFREGEAPSEPDDAAAFRKAPRPRIVQRRLEAAVVGAECDAELQRTWLPPRIHWRQEERLVRTWTKQVHRRNGHPDKAILANIIRRVVEVGEPERITLFGSAARDEMGPDSHIDLLVIKAGRFNRWQLMTAIYRHLRGKRAAVDFVVVTPEEVTLYRDSPYLVIHAALSEGKVVYGA